MRDAAQRVTLDDTIIGDDILTETENFQNHSGRNRKASLLREDKKNSDRKMALAKRV